MALALERKTPETKRAEKAARARARTAARRSETKKTTGKRIRRLEAAIAERYKPLDEWDEEELARGRPRTITGDFRGPAPSWLPRAVHEEALSRYTELARGQARALVPKALKLVDFILTTDEVDDRGKPLVPAGVKLDAAKWVVEHLLGKPTQRTEMDISVKLQSLLGAALVQPGEDGALELSAGRGEVIDAELVEEEEDSGE